MKVLIGFMLGMFVLSGTKLGRRYLARSWVVVGFSAVAAASYWSLRVIG